MLRRWLAKRNMTLLESGLALNAAVRSSNTESIKKIIALYPELLRMPDGKGAFPLHWAAEVQSLASVACLVDLGVDPHQKDQMGYIPEQVAYWHGEFRMGAYTDVCLKIVERLKNAQKPKHA